jgi:hypothetical protein
MPLATGFRFSAMSSSEPLRVPEDCRRWATDSDGETNPRHPDGATANSSRFSVGQYFSEQRERRMVSLAVRLAEKETFGSEAIRQRRAGNGVAPP